jgi:hypothetical protein
MKLRKEQKQKIREQSKEVAAYMEKPQKYQVIWTCPQCGNEHNWWWEDKWEAHDDGELDMVCDRCEKTTRCKGDGNGLYEPIVKIEEKWPGVGPNFESVLDELRNSRKVHFSLINKLLDRTDDLDSLNTDVHNYTRELETKVNKLAERVLELEKKEEKDPLDALIDDAVKKQPSILDLLDGPKQPFYERFREGCEFTKETLSGENIAKMLRFVAVEVEKMTERDMGGSYTISNLKVGEKLREMADEAQVEDYDGSDGEEKKSYAAGFDWGAFAEYDYGEDDPNNPALAEDGN